MRQRAKEQMPRLAGVPFFLRARKLMFDDAGHLLSPPTLATAQALCLLEMHEVAASHSWTLHYRYFGKFLERHNLSDHVGSDHGPAFCLPLLPTAVLRLLAH